MEHLLLQQVRDRGHRLVRQAEVVETDADAVRSLAEDWEARVQMAVDAANGKP